VYLNLRRLSVVAVLLLGWLVGILAIELLSARRSSAMVLNEKDWGLKGLGYFLWRSKRHV
jgi:hypothetical protein